TACTGLATLDGEAWGYAAKGTLVSETGLTEEPESPACPACTQPVGPLQHICPHCGTPLTSFAATDPIRSIYTEGELFRRGVARPKLIVVAGIWLISLPAIGMAVIVGSEGFSVASILSGAFFLGLYGTI